MCATELTELSEEVRELKAQVEELRRLAKIKHNLLGESLGSPYDCSINRRGAGKKTSRRSPYDCGGPLRLHR